jgi:polo-like kinase 1
MEIIEKPSKLTEPVQIKSNVYVAKWIDYSTKYGVGYLLNNGASGVFFNDGSKVIFHQSSS